MQKIKVHGILYNPCTLFFVLVKKSGKIMPSFFENVRHLFRKKSAPFIKMLGAFFIDARQLYPLFTPWSESNAAELDRTTLALQSNEALFYAVRTCILVDTIDIDGDGTVLHENIGLVPFARCCLSRVGMFLYDRKLWARFARFALILNQIGAS